MCNNNLKILFIGDGRYSNRGCEAIVRCTVEVITKKFQQSRFILCPFGNSDKLKKDAKNETDKHIEHLICNPYISRFSWAWWKYRIFLRAFPQKQIAYQFDIQHKAAMRSDCSIVLGGDNYSLDYGVPKNLVKMGQLLLLTGKPLILWGASIGPFSEYPEFEDIMRQHLSSFALICVRESETVNYLKTIGIEKNVRLVADPAFVMAPKKPDLSDELFEFIKKNPVGLNLSPLIGRYKLEFQKQKWVQDAAECINKLVNAKTGSILLVPHVFDDGNNDYEFMVEAVEKKAGWSKDLKILPPTLSAAEYKWCISQLKGFAGARTHTTIASLSTCTPTISIGYSMKARGINKDIFGHFDWLLPVGDLSPESLLEKIKILLGEEKNIRTELKQKIPVFNKRALSAGDYLAEIL